MKVLLIQPHSSEIRTIGPPLGLGYLASCLEQEDHEVKIIDSIILNSTLLDIQKSIKQFNPDVVGVTTVASCISDSLKIAHIVKNNNPDCLTVFGGPYASFKDGEILNNNNFVDVIVRGEGEKTLTELLEIDKKNDFNSIKGISFQLNGKIYKNPDRELIHNIDSIPFPAHHLFPMEKYVVQEKFSEIGLVGKQGTPYGSIISSRGCPYSCVFCSDSIFNKSKCRARSPENVIEELKILRYKYGKKIIDFLDSTFTFDKKRTIKLCNLIIDEGIDISWMCSTRVDFFDRTLALSLKKAGCYLVFFGMESGDQSIINSYNKSIKLENIEKAVKIAKQSNLDVIGSFIIGAPNDTRATINKTISFARKLNIKSVRFPFLIPFPGTPLFEMLDKNNLLLTKNWSLYSGFNPIVKIANLSESELRKLQKKAAFLTMLKPSFIFKIIKGIIP